MAQLADAEDSKSSVRKDMRVRSPLRAPRFAVVPDPTSLSKPVVRRVRRMVLLAAALAAVVFARDKIISDVERREADRLGLKP
jgi:hypothetical protein